MAPGSANFGPLSIRGEQSARRIILRIFFWRGLRVWLGGGGGISVLVLRIRGASIGERGHRV